MSISIGHRAIFTAFGHRARIARRAAIPARVAEVPQPAAQGAWELKCSPWEGLYLERATAVSEAPERCGSRAIW